MMLIRILLLALSFIFCLASQAQKISAHAVDGHEYVDLGLPSGLLWAACNVGAESDVHLGWYLAWGETKPQSNNSYSWASYKWSNGSSDSITKYCTHSEKGRVDNNGTLERADDAASVNWGGAWRTPTNYEWTELRTVCAWTWVSNYNGVGVAGMIVSGPNGNSLFLPAAGYRCNGTINYVGFGGNYWSASLYAINSDGAYDVIFDSINVDRNGRSRVSGCSVRPVCNPQKHK